ncbi:hypothetical protein MAR_017771 [Mya arenaria]|uniref:Uncharacterized protein n=1 Tax=Mya arenaria TaxID=6604 RepID=A0ABY7ECR9_MYAAR|nr:hypothetical protein MAR_017771 [Mya arenaria]
MDTPETVEKLDDVLRSKEIDGVDITCGILHVCYSAVGLNKCFEEVRTGYMTCNPEERPRLMLTEGFNLAFGSIIILLSVVFTVYLSVRGTLQRLTGATSGQGAPHSTCCYGHCNVYVNSVVVS